ncbi:hypothetical protein B0H15DRAFT_935501 [Mycena belliarum]|uniref:Uncharacterized protein n=1 Tax=Mycena belliarum TaxID=1033014 RepID=A0AAD6TMV1_9AGAR|nr:hypothetical protein B0H15DRAFT_935501 [Mycena belliae]
MVDHRVLEEGAERTVSISTWREQAIQEADSDDDMSIYYVNAEDCRADDTVTEIVEVGGVARLPVKTKDGSGSNNWGHRNKESTESSRRPQHGSTSTEQVISSNIRPSTSRNLMHHAASASPSIRSSAPRTSTPRGSGTLVQILDPPGEVFSPFHATRSGSTISSIRLTPAPTLEHILASCRPSLLHISPILQRVGILRAEHLRAVGKLSEDTRNREVREEVLKLGVTVVEWAILLDRLRDL